MLHTRQRKHKTGVNFRQAVMLSSCIPPIPLNFPHRNSHLERKERRKKNLKKTTTSKRRPQWLRNPLTFKRCSSVAYTVNSVHNTKKKKHGAVSQICTTRHTSESFQTTISHPPFNRFYRHTFSHTLHPFTTAFVQSFRGYATLCQIAP